VTVSVARRSECAFLAGVAVLEIGDGIAGATASALLSSLGASVTTIADPESPHRRSRPALPAGPRSVLSLLLDADKRLLELPVTSSGDLAAVIDNWHRQVSAAGEIPLVVADRVSGSLYGIEDLCGASAYAYWVANANRQAWVTISAFGLSGPRRDDGGTELTISAASGILSAVQDAAAGSPLKLAGYQALRSAGQAAALASCHAIDLSSSAEPAHLDLSAQEASIATGPILRVAQILLDAVGPAGASRYGAPSGFYPCRDGLIRISVMEDHQWRGVVKAMGSPGWTEQFAVVGDRIEGAAQVDARIAEWTTGQRKVDAEVVLQEQGVPAAAIYRPAEILHSPQLEYRDAMRAIAAGDGETIRAVGRPFVEVPSDGGDGAGRRRRPLRGLRVAEAGRVLAVPLAGALLGALGARVTKLEDLSHIDMYRRRGPFVSGQPGINRAAYFILVNHSKSNFVADLDRDPGQLEQLLLDTDVVIENIGRRRGDALGLSAYAPASSTRPALRVSSSAFGYDGPYARYRAYAYSIHAACGLAYLTRNAAGEPATLDLPWADLVCAYGIATIVAAWAVGPRGNDPAGIDFSMAEMITARFNEFLAGASIDEQGDEYVDRVNESSPSAPTGVYRVADGWMAVSVTTDEMYRELTAALGHPFSLLDDRFATENGRFAARAELDLALEAEISGHAGGELAACLRERGIPCEPVLTPRQLTEDPHLAERGFFTPLTHPELGTRQVIGIPWRPMGGGAIPLASPPTMDPGQLPAATED
jgi:crotonobetainyl-CoA:carnitine CoA-transferase CaiB-like acyl-CoA transferase